MAKKTQTGVTDEDFAEAIANPQSFSVEGLSQTNRSVSEMIAADKYIRKRELARRRNLLGGLVTHMVPPGTCDR